MGKNVLRVAVVVAVLLYAGNKLYADGHKPEGNGLASDSQSHKYIGANKCKMCHASESKGNQYKVWSESKHAKAYQDLATDDAKKAAEKAGLKTDAQKSAECLKCHVTAYSEKEDLKGEILVTDGIQCESCHGAGGDYKSLSVMKDKQQAIAAGLVIPDKEMCIKCHNSESPYFKGFDFDSFYKKIAHPRPKA